MTIGFATICSEGYFNFFTHFLRSLLKHNPTFDYDFNVFCDGRLPLGLRHRLKKIYSRIIFKEVDNVLYEKHYKCSLKFYSFELFMLDYDRVIYMDSDMICLKSVDELIEVAKGIEGVGMVREKRRGSCLPFNAGLIIINKSLLTDGTRFNLLNSNYDTLEGHLMDQKVYNYYFKDRIEEIHLKFNTLLSEIDFIKRDEIIFLHYIFKANDESSRKRILSWQLEEYDSYEDISNNPDI